MLKYLFIFCCLIGVVRSSAAEPLKRDGNGDFQESLNKEKITVKIQFLGTGAADWNWSRPLTPERRGSCSTLLDGHILIDAGKTVLENLALCKIDPAEITDLFLTHSHSDHFNPDAVRAIAAAPGRREKLRLYATPQVTAKFGDELAVHPLKWGETVELERWRFLVMPSNHLVRDPHEETFHYLVTTPGGKTLLYALDGAWFTTRERALIGKTKLDLIIWDATSGTSEYDWRFAEHNDLRMVDYMIKSLTGTGNITPETVHVLDHTAQSLWPKSPDACEEKARAVGAMLAKDGMIISL